MSQFEINVEWESPEGARGEELRATWAHLRIRAGDTCVTRVYSHVSQSVRDGIFVPMYPIAEWLASNWWALLHEVPSPRSTGRHGYGRRHNLRSAAEGFALPDLLIQPEGSRIVLQMQRANQPSNRVTFLEQERIALPRESVEGAFRNLVRAVVARMDEQGVGETFLAQEWAAIEAADPEERAFCTAIGLLGGDPYTEHAPDFSAGLVELADTLPNAALEEFLSAVEWSDLLEAGRQLTRFAEVAMGSELDLEPLLQLREHMVRDQRKAPANGVPWRQGYEFARALRRELDMGPVDSLPPSGKMGAILGTKPDQWERCLSGSLPGCECVSAAVAPTRNNFPYFALHGSFESNRMFALCRGLFEYLSMEIPQTAVATGAYSERQKRNRAFAAEFIAPAVGIQQHTPPSGVVSEEEVAGIAGHFRTSEYVIRHQIQNHQIADIQESVEV